MDIIELDILMKIVEGTHVDRALASSRLSDGGEDAEDWARHETERYAKKGYFHVRAFSMPADPTISEPGTG